LDFKHPTEKDEGIKLLNVEKILEGTKDNSTTRKERLKCILIMHIAYHGNGSSLGKMSDKHMKCIKILHRQTYADQYIIILQNFPDLKYKMTSKLCSPNFSNYMQTQEWEPLSFPNIIEYIRGRELPKKSEQLIFRTTIYVQVAMQKKFHKLQPLKTSKTS